MSSLFRYTAFLVLFSASLVGLNACGNKGPLYLPPPPAEQRAPAPEQAPAEDS
ncbi:MAG TPA: hypothetical protein DCZ13_07805 [Porticoccaceae bacterium]|nr:hypothetical protein [Porticoccaceae bacterium]